MGRISQAMQTAEAENRAALIIYLCAGDPDLQSTPSLVKAIADAGADIIELGMPFSDPSADGPTIQAASERALAAGTTMRGVLEAVRQVRALGCEVPILLFGYCNPVLRYGEAKLAKDAAAAGVDGMLVVDLPLEESEPLRQSLEEHGLEFVPLVAPTTPPLRAKRSAAAATGFVYSISMTGITGAKAAALGEASERAAELRALFGKPVAVGFGVRTPEDVAVVASKADGVIVGSAVVRAIDGAEEGERAQAAAALVASYRERLGR